MASKNRDRFGNTYITAFYHFIKFPILKTAEHFYFNFILYFLMSFIFRILFYLLLFFCNDLYVGAVQRSANDPLAHRLHCWLGMGTRNCQVISCSKYRTVLTGSARFTILALKIRYQANLNPLIYLYFTVKSHYK